MKYKGFTYTPAPKTAWDNLSMREKSEMMKVAVRNGITDLKTIREKYNEFAEGGNLYAGTSTDNDLVDWIIKEEGFTAKPTDIGDGKMTLGSGLTSQKWRDLYKRRGNKWSETDNRSAVAQEVADRRRWAEKNIPNWDTLPESSQKALLAYKYNYDFNAANSPKLFKALRDSNLHEAARQMNATSRDPKFQKGLMDRRKREQAWFLSDVGMPDVVPSSTPIIAQPVSTSVYNPYPVKIQNTTVAPRMVPDKDSYVKAHQLTEREIRQQKLQERWDAINRFNTLMEMFNIQNNPLKQFTSNNPIFSGIEGLIHADGGKIHIKPENRGKFTRLKERTGHSATWFKEHGTPAQKKMATFALNSRHWKHRLGGNLFENGGNENSMNYEYRGTVFDDDLKNQGITHVAELPEVVIKGRDYTKPYKSAFEYDPNFAKELPYFLPIVGDALDVADIAKDIYNGDYLNAGIGVGLFVLPNFIEKPIKKIGRKAYQLLTAPTRKAAEKGRSTLLEAIPSSWNRERWNIAAPYENTDAIINDLEQRARTVPFNYSKTSDKLKATGSTVPRPALVYYKDGKKVKDYYNSGLDVYVASDIGKKAYTTGIHEPIHYITGNSNGLPKVGIPKFGSLFEPVEINFDAIKETLIPPSTLYQHGMVDYNDSLLPKINRNSKAVIEGDDYALNKQENQTWLKTWFLSDIKPHLKNPNDANEIESFLNEHPELIEKNYYVNTLMKDTRSGTNKDYSKALSRILYSTLVTAGLLNTVKDE